MRGGVGTALSRWFPGRVERGRRPRGRVGRVLGPERKVGPYPLDLDIVHVTGEVAGAHLGSSS